MHVLCHRCHASLPPAAPGSSRGDEDALLFCPRCGAPQILLPEHLRPDPPAILAVGSTGAAPPPRPVSVSPIDWQAAIKAGALVACIGAVLATFGIKSNGAALLCILWTISGAVIALGIYSRGRAEARMDARIGLRIGIATGLTMSAAMGLGLAGAGLVMRFGTHSMAAIDEENSAARKAMLAKEIELSQQIDDKDLQAQYVAKMTSPEMNSPEMFAGLTLSMRAFEMLLILLFSACGGAFAGMMRAVPSARPGLRRGD
jgi:hypothetical protein